MGEPPAMRAWTLRTAILALALWAGCAKEQAAAPDAAATPAPRLDGQLRRNDVWIKVAPPILHDAKMDLATRCRLLVDEARGKGQAVPLCYDAVRRPERAVTRIAIERDTSMARAMQRLTARNEGVHFVVDHSGAIYQVLDLAFAARHGGVYPAEEIRVIACDEGGEKALTAALREIYPGVVASVDESERGAEP
jgi:hypothetical protein